MNKEYKFSCGCSFPIENGKLRFIKDAHTVWDDLNYDCKATWDIMSIGDSKGMFQIESSFGRQLCKKAPIFNIDDLSHLIAAQRPGATQSFLDDKKSLSDHYFMRKSGQEEPTPFHPALEPLLRDTQSILLYQEQAMAISMDIAGFTAVEADILRKAAGKKDSKLMASLKDKFIDGCVRVGKVKREDGEMIFSWLEASQRYSFNRSHSVGYAYMTYMTAYEKAHFNINFFKAWLSDAQNKTNKQEEIQELYSNARQSEILINNPDFRLLNKHFQIKNNQIYFGLSDLKDVGGASLDKILVVTKEVESKIGSRTKWSYNNLLFGFLPYIGLTSAKNLILAGAFDYISSNRTRLKYEFEAIIELKKAVSWNWLVDNYQRFDNAIGVISAMMSEPSIKAVSKKKIESVLKTLTSPSFKLEDTAAYLAGEERRIMGVAVTCTDIDGCDISSANCTLKDYQDGKDGYLLIGVNIDHVKEVTIKNANSNNVGKRMAFISISDSTAAIQDLPIFVESWSQFKAYLSTGNTVMLAGKRHYKSKVLMIEKVYQI